MKFGVIGFGNMGGAIVRGALAKGTLRAEDVNVYDILENKNEEARALGLHVSADDEALCKESDIVLLAVKPQQMAEALGMTKKALDGKAMLSIVAGVSIDRLQAAIDGTPRILRLLPNTPALVFEGAFGLCKETDFTAEEKQFAVDLFESIGVVEWVKEYDIDAVCGLSGGGPAYVAMFIEALADGGVKQGLTRPVATKLAAQTVLGTAKMILETGMHPGQVKDMVSSPAGTTIEGVEALEAGGMRHAVMRAVVVATDRSREL
ncbi:MAG: pyrroline-5-carboxylate reductase [Mogibacterium sp.]|nr:pyrroline-5-carboxylate reductase [Mogibacterium sp.]